MTESTIKLAEAQLIGFGHASQGYSIKEFADSMALTKYEWEELRNLVPLKPSDKAALDQKYGIK